MLTPSFSFFTECIILQAPPEFNPNLTAQDSIWTLERLTELSSSWTNVVKTRIHLLDQWLNHSGKWHSVGQYMIYY